MRGKTDNAKRWLPLVNIVVNEGSKISEADAGKMADSMKDHGWSDWYFSLLHAALDESRGDVAGAILLANQAHDAQPEPPAEEEGGQR